MENVSVTRMFMLSVFVFWFEVYYHFFGLIMFSGSRVSCSVSYRGCEWKRERRNPRFFDATLPDERPVVSISVSESVLVRCTYWFGFGYRFWFEKV